MAIAYVGTNGDAFGASSSSIQRAAGFAVAVGDVIAVMASFDDAAGVTTFGFLDTLGNTYTDRVTKAHANGTTFSATASCVVTNAGTPTITCNFGAARTTRRIVFIVGRPDTDRTLEYDASAAGGAGTGSPGSSGSYAVADRPRFSAMLGVVSTGGWTPQDSWSEVRDSGSTMSAHLIEASGTTVEGKSNPTTGSATWILHAMTFREPDTATFPPVLHQPAPIVLAH